MFEDEEGETILPFPCVSAFVLDSMHLLGGGVFKDFIKSLATAVTWKFDPNEPNLQFGARYTDTKILTVLEEKIVWMNKFRFPEQARSLR